MFRESGVLFPGIIDPLFTHLDRRLVIRSITGYATKRQTSSRSRLIIFQHYNACLSFLIIFVRELKQNQYSLIV